MARHDDFKRLSSCYRLNFGRFPGIPSLKAYPKGTTKMVVRAGREFLAIHGPNTIPVEVLRAMHRPALDIYSEQMVNMTDSLLRDLSKLFATEGHSYIYIANGHGAWEAVLSNVLSRGDKVLVLESGRFAIGWGNAAAAMGAEVEVLKGDSRRAIRLVAASGRAREVHKKADPRTAYWDWTEREGAEHYRKYAGTAPVHLLFALRQAIDMLFDEKLENAFLRHRLLAESVRRAVAVWAEGQVLGFNIAEAGERSDTVTTVVMGNGHDPLALQRYCKAKCAVVLGVGIGELTGQAFRIAHMGHVNAPMILGTLGVIEVGLNALDIPHGKGGLEAAVEWLGESVSP